MPVTGITTVPHDALRKVSGNHMSKSKKAEFLLTKARVSLMLEYPWFGSMVLRLPMESTEGASGEVARVETMATDGNRLVYHPPFVESLTPQELLGVLAHEVMHCALLHPYRRGVRDPQRWNIATDYAINLIVVDSGLTLPKGVLLNQKYKGMSADTIYNMLPPSITVEMVQASQMGEVMDSPGDGKGKGEGDQDGDKDGPGSGKGKGEGKGDESGDGQGKGMSETDWKIAAKQAEMVASKAGKMPGSVSRELGSIRASETDWRVLLKRFVTSTYRHDSTWARPSRRSMASGGIMLPGILKENTGEIVVAIDTSGSVTPQMLEQFCGEIQAIKDETRPERLHILYCDARINGHAEFTPDMDITVKMCGGGGTAFQPVFDWIKDKGIEPKCLIYLTDLESFDCPPEPQYPVLWVTPDWVSKGWAWGEIVRIKV